MSIDLIRAKQQELQAAKDAVTKLAAEREETAKKAFSETGIPAMWAAIKDVQVPHFRGSGSRENEHVELVPLSSHAKAVTDRTIALLDWDGERKASWGVEVTDKNAVWFVRRFRTNTEPRVYYAAEKLRDDFVEYMAEFLPPLEETKA